MDNQDLQAELARLREENSRLKAPKAAKQITMKVADKGGLSVYGLGRFPVTLYKEQWIKLLEIADEIREFIANNEDRLKTKDKD